MRLAQPDRQAALLAPFHGLDEHPADRFHAEEGTGRRSRAVRGRGGHGGEWLVELPAPARQIHLPPVALPRHQGVLEDVGPVLELEGAAVRGGAPGRVHPLP